MATFQDYEDAIRRGGVTYIAKIEFLNLEDETVKGGAGTVTGKIVDGGIAINKNNGARRSVGLDLTNLGGEFTPSEDGLVWINSKFTVFLGIRFYNPNSLTTEDYYIQQGIFVTRSPQTQSFNKGSIFSLEGVDKFSLYNGQMGGKIDSAFIFQAGDDIITRFKDVLGVKLDEGETIPRDPKTPLIPPLEVGFDTLPYDLIEKSNSTLSRLWDQMRYVTSRDLYYDRTGRCNFKDNIPDIEKSAVWHFKDNEATYLGSTITLDSEKVVNKVIVKGANINGAIAYGEAVNRDLQSTTCVQKIGVKVTEYSVPSISTNAQAQAYAEYLLKFVTLAQNSGTITCVPLPHLDVDEIIQLTDSSQGFNQKRFVIIGIEMDLGADTMSLTIVDTDEFIVL